MKNLFYISLLIFIIASCKGNSIEKKQNEKIEYSKDKSKMQIKKQSKINQLISLHGNDTLKKWVENLEIFYLYKSAGGIGDDNGEDFRTPIEYSDLKDLIIKLGQIGIELRKIPTDSPKPEKGKSYTSEEYSKFKRPINNEINYEQPRHSIVFNQKCFIWIYKEYFTISVTGNGDEYHKSKWLVDDSDYEICKSLDLALKKISWDKYVKRDLESDVRYISRNEYLELLK